MNNNTATSNRPNACKPVYKFNSKGKLVHTYLRISDAIKEEHVNYVHLKELIASGNSLNGYSFSLFSNRENTVQEMIPSITDEKAVQMPWESENGMFDISGWAKVCL